jgi:hypothetical protein
MMLNNFITPTAEVYEKGNSYQSLTLDGSETSTLSPAYSVAAQALAELNTAQRKRIDGMAAQKAAVASDPAVEVLALPLRAGAIVSGRHQRITLTPSQEDTNRLIAAGKLLGP